MITKKQRMFYLKIVGIFFISGIIIYGMIASFANFSPLFIYILLGGSLLGGLASGGILFGRFIKRRNSTILIVLSGIFFPITLFIIMLVGVYPLIPYYIYNIIKYIQIRKEPEQISIPVRKPKKNPWIAVIVLSALLVMALVQYILKNINEADIAQAIYTKTGYPAGSPDNVITRHFFYSAKNTDYASDMEYDYKIIDGMLFAVANNNNQYSNKIFYQYPDKTFSISDKYECYSNSSGKYLHPDLDALFSNVQLIKSGNTYAYVLLIDARNDEEHIADYVSGINSSLLNKDITSIDSDNVTIQFILGQVDRTYADPDRIKLLDINGEPINHIGLDNGKYVAFCGTMLLSEKDYLLSASYEGETYTLLTYEDIINFNIGSLVPTIPNTSPSHTAQP